MIFCVWCKGRAAICQSGESKANRENVHFSLTYQFGREGGFGDTLGKTTVEARLTLVETTAAKQMIRV